MRCHNPIDTPEQRAHERLALAYHQHPEIVAERERLRDLWLELAAPSPVMRRWSGLAPMSRNSGFTADWVRPKLN